jgi:hypothetical protein
MNRFRLSAAVALALGGSLAEAAPHSGFDAYPAWDQPLPSLLEFVALAFPASAAFDYGSRWDLVPGVAATPQQPPLTLTAAEGGSTLRALEHIRFDGRITLIGDFTFEAPSIAHAPTAYVVSDGNLSFLTTSQLEFESGSRVDFIGGDVYLLPVSGEGGSTVSLSTGPVPSAGAGSSGAVLSGGSRLTAGQSSPRSVDVTRIYSRDTVGLDAGSLVLAPVPLPAALPLLVSGVGLLAARARRRDLTPSPHPYGLDLPLRG